jgi:hypothetical protein
MVETYRDPVESDEHPEEIALREADREYHRLVVQPEIDDMVQRHDDILFYQDAEPYTNGSNFDFPVQRARVLGKHYKKFSPKGNQPLVDVNGGLIREPGYVGTIFKKVVNGVRKRLDDQH